MNIRKAVETDITYMTSIYNDSINLFPKNIRKESDYDHFVDIFNSNVVYIIEDSSLNKEIGWIAYKIQPNHAFIAGFYLLIEEQRKGIGTKMLEYCIDILKQNNCKIIILKVLKIAPWSIEFYLKNGFTFYDTNTENNKDLDFLKVEIVNNWELMMYKRI